MSEVSPRAMSYAVTRDHRRDSDLEASRPRPLSLGLSQESLGSQFGSDMREWNWEKELMEEDAEGGVFML